MTALILSACGDDEDKSSAQTSAAPRCAPAAGTSSTTASIKPKWSAGDTRSITISRTREETGQASKESSATADLSVLEVGSQGSRLRWKSADVVLADDQIPAESQERLKDVARGFEVVYTTDESGAYEAKQNVAEIRRQLTKVLDLLEEDTDEAEAVRRTRPIILSDAFIQTSVVKEIPALHSVYGLELKEGDPQSVTRRIPSPFGGAALTAKGAVELIEARDENGCAVVELDVRPDRDALTKSIADVFGGKAKNVPPAAKRARLSLHSTSRFTYDPGTGWLVRADLTQSARSSGKSRSDITVITAR